MAPQLFIAAISSPQQPDLARGLLEILRWESNQKMLGRHTLAHVHALSKKEWSGPYLGEEELVLPPREGEAGRTDRLNAAVALAADSGADYGLFLETDLWPLFPRLLRALVHRVTSEGRLLGAAAMLDGPRQAAPRGGIWPRFFILDLSWQRSKRLFPLVWDQWVKAVLVRADHWEAPNLAGLLSSSFFRRLTESLPEPEAARDLALTQLTRFTNLEPVLTTGQREKMTWAAMGMIRDPRSHKRAAMVKDAGATEWGPTLARLVKEKDKTWFNSNHDHPLF